MKLRTLFTPAFHPILDCLFKIREKSLQIGKNKYNLLQNFMNGARDSTPVDGICFYTSKHVIALFDVALNFVLCSGTIHETCFDDTNNKFSIFYNIYTKTLLFGSKKCLRTSTPYLYHVK